MLNTAIIGAGPYGLSIAAHFRSQGISFPHLRPSHGQLAAHMPKGMMLKSDGFASNISDPDDRFTLGKFCAERESSTRTREFQFGSIPSRDTGLRSRNGWCRELENKLVVSVERSSEGYRLQLERWREVQRSKRSACGRHYPLRAYVPENLAHLPAEFLSHSAPASGSRTVSWPRSVVVIGGGSSALDWAALLHEAGSATYNWWLVKAALKFHGKPTGKQRSLWERIQRPQTGLGPGWRSSFYANAPAAFHRLPDGLRSEIVKRTLGPSGGWFVKDRVMNHVPQLLGQTVQRAQVKDEKVHLHVRAQDGTERRFGLIMSSRGLAIRSILSA